FLASAQRWLEGPNPRRVGPNGQAHLFYDPAQLPLAKERRAAHKGICAGPGALRGCLQIDPAIDFDAVAEMFFPAPRRGLLDFWKHLLHERLAAEAGIDRHDEEHIDLPQVGLG